MANIRPPQYGVEKDELTLTSQDPAAVIYGVNPNSKFIPVKVDDTGALMIGSSITLNMSDIEIGAVELKNYNTDDRAYVSPAHEVLAQSRVYDAAGTGITSTNVLGKQGLDVNLLDGLTNDDNSVPAGMDVLATVGLLYGYDGVDWERIKSASGRLVIDGSQVTQPISAVSLPLPTGAATEATLSTRATETTLSTRATETTLLAVKTDLDKFTFLGGSVNSNITNATLAVTQSGVWSTGRTWTLASGTDSVSSVQSGTWNINNITGTVNLPTGAATELTLSNIKTQTDKLTFASTRLLVDGSGVTQPISAVSLPLPTGAATETTLSALNAKFNSLGQKTMANSAPVVIASDQTVIPVSDNGGSLTVDGTITAAPQTSTTGTTTSVSRSNTSVTLLASNVNRKGATIYNDAAANLFVKLGATASSTDFTTRLQNNDYFEVPFDYTGVIDGIWASSGAGAARVTELT